MCVHSPKVHRDTMPEGVGGVAVLHVHVCTLSQATIGKCPSTSVACSS